MLSTFHPLAYCPLPFNVMRFMEVIFHILMIAGVTQHYHVYLSLKVHAAAQVSSIISTQLNKNLFKELTDRYFHKLDLLNGIRALVFTWSLRFRDENILCVARNKK